MLKTYIDLLNKKKKTRATEAKRKGLEPLAIWMKARKHEVSIEEKAQQFINEEVQSVENAIRGAQDIIAEQISDNPKYRTKILKDMYHQGVLTTSKKRKMLKMKKVFLKCTMHIVSQLNALLIIEF